MATTLRLLAASLTPVHASEIASDLFTEDGVLSLLLAIFRSEQRSCFCLQIRSAFCLFFWYDYAPYGARHLMYPAAGAAAFL